MRIMSLNNGYSTQTQKQQTSFKAVWEKGSSKTLGEFAVQMFKKQQDAEGFLTALRRYAPDIEDLKLDGYHPIVRLRLILGDEVSNDTLEISAKHPNLQAIGESRILMGNAHGGDSFSGQKGAEKFVDYIKQAINDIKTTDEYKTSIESKLRGLARSVIYPNRVQHKK